MEREDYVEKDHARTEKNNRPVKELDPKIARCNTRIKADGMTARIRDRMPEDCLTHDVQEFARSMSMELGVVCDELRSACICCSSTSRY